MIGAVSITVLIGACVYMIAMSMVLQRGKSARIRARLSVLTIWMIAIVLWPVCWALILREERNETASLPGLMWPIFILTLDIVAMRQNTYESHVQSKRSLLSMDANAICSLTFAIASIIGAQKHKCCNRIFLFAVLGCIAFVMPAPHTNMNAIETMTVEAVQKAVLAYATGLLLTGVMLVVAEKDEVGLVHHR